MFVTFASGHASVVASKAVDEGTGGDDTYDFRDMLLGVLHNHAATIIKRLPEGLLLL